MVCLVVEIQVETEIAAVAQLLSSVVLIGGNQS